MATQKTSNSEDIIKVENGRLIVDVALGHPTPSSSGKTMVHFSTRGNLAINDGFVIGLNLYKKGR